MGWEAVGPPPSVQRSPQPLRTGWSPRLVPSAGPLPGLTPLLLSTSPAPGARASRGRCSPGNELPGSGSFPLCPSVRGLSFRRGRGRASRADRACGRRANTRAPPSPAPSLRPVQPGSPLSTDEPSCTRPLAVVLVSSARPPFHIRFCLRALGLKPVSAVTSLTQGLTSVL